MQGIWNPSIVGDSGTDHFDRASWFAVALSEMIGDLPLHLAGVIIANKSTECGKPSGNTMRGAAVRLNAHSLPIHCRNWGCT